MRITTTRRRTSATLLAGAVLIALATTACGPTTGASVSTQPKKSAAAGAPSSAKPAGAAKAPTVAKVGDTIALKGTDKGASADITVVKVVDNAQSSDDYNKPADGKRWIAVQLRIKNTGTAAYNDDPENGTTLLDDQSQSYNPTVADITAGQSFPTPLAIAPGDSALGFITFEVPVATKLVKAQFALDSGFADQSGQWQLS
ncbi:hypothetical protein P3T36_001365 [Kitasatospora sp. MAP12-15]|uniref:DUF4352 domain-containing protein n=1 Tax=unclassified Kitasatospora TaxID=2633591 RepID=UPI00247692BB|nr:DUF4352 domain-containing protein [Kitasatospora sp. MAP12-44]MDH6112482.1 hypothetical protein [Kitasatospora sp. MAP12-44]